MASALNDGRGCQLSPLGSHLVGSASHRAERQKEGRTMSKKSNVNPEHYKLAGRDRPGEDILHKQNKQKFRQAKAAASEGTPNVIPGAQVISGKSNTVI